MSRRKIIQTVTMAALLALTGVAQTAPAAAKTTRSEPDCNNRTSTRQALFGDLHVHTRYSFDSYLSSQRNTPDDAYRYAKGEVITLPNTRGEQLLKASIGRPIDFAAVTDHAEFLGQVNVCTSDPASIGYWWPHCALMRSQNIWLQLISASWWTKLGGQQETETETSFVCSLGDCAAGEASFWSDIQAAAERHYDRSSDCQFTTFIGYEFTDAPNQNNMHRNVIFRNTNVPKSPISTYDTGRGNFTELWSLLRQECTDQDSGCDVITIPHNPNLSGGLMFRDPLTETEQNDRLFFEPIIELTQHKGSSECRFDRLRGIGLDTEDTLCDFEQVVSDNLTMLGSVNGKVRTARADPVTMEQFGARNMARNALKAGLVLEQKNGVNPMAFGFIGSTDTHSATAGGAEEDNYVGHLGRRDADYRNVQDHFFSNPGGYAVVWAEQNSRDSIFNAMKRRETYATSGTRPIIRFFAGDYPDNLCEQPDQLITAYRHGVPMGGELLGSNQTDGPSFFVSAAKDNGTPTVPGVDLQRLQIIKGWVDATGQSHETVYDVAGGANQAGIDPSDCRPTGSGHAQLCTVWHDPKFDPEQSAFYYLRAIENPSCRWSTRQCLAANVSPFSPTCSTDAEVASQFARDNLGASGDVYGNCCTDPNQQPFYSPVIQERAWSSPIWYKPNKKPN